MARQTTKPLAAAVGAAFMASIAIAPIASATENPFQAAELSAGYNLADGHEGKCGEDKADAEGKCGEDKANAEGKCGEDKAPAEGKCGEGKCGEGKCGENK